MSRPHARLRLACAVTLAGIGMLLGAAPALAAGGETGGAPAAGAGVAASTDATASTTTTSTSTASADAAALTPLVDCIQDAPLGAVASRTVVLGYRSTASTAVTVAAGSGRNDLTTGAADRGQPAVFAPGEHHGVWLLTVDAAAEPDVGWRLGGATAAFDGAPACTSATAVAVSAPVEVAAGDTAMVSATVTRLLLAPPSDGTVSFALDDGPAVTAPVSATGIARAELPVPGAGAHTVTATYRPSDGSALLPSTGSASLNAVAAAAPLTVAVDSVVAGSSSVQVTVARTSATGSASVDLMTADGTARAGADYEALATTVALADGEASATFRIALPARPAGSPAATFFVLLQRASTAVTTASATVRLPEVPAAPAAAEGAHAGTGGASGVSSALPPGDPTAGAPATATMNSAQDLAVLAGGLLLTGGGILGVLGLVRAAGMRDARV